jgi:hypothetical protein
MVTDLANRLEEAAAALRSIEPARDWLDEINDAAGDALRSDEAAFIWDIHVDTMRDRTKAAAAAGKPIAVLQTAA